MFRKSSKVRPTRLFFMSLLLILNLGLAACSETSQSLTLSTATPATSTQSATVAPAPEPTFMAVRTTGAPASTRTSQPQPAVTNPPTSGNPTTATVAAPFSLPPASPAITPASPSKSSLAQLDETSNGTLAYEFEGDIWVMVLPEGMQRPLTSDGANTKTTFPDGYNRQPVWSPGSLLLAFASPAEASLEPDYQKGYDIYTIRPDGSVRTRLTKGPDSAYVKRLPLGWFSSDEIIISQYDNKNPQSGLAPLALLEVATGKIKDLPVKQTGISEVAVSRDGSQIAYVVATLDTKTNSTKADIFLVPTAGGQPKALTDLPGGVYQSISALAWSPDGQNLAFIQAVGDGCGTYNLYTVTSEGKGLRKLHNSTGFPLTLSYSVNGAWLTYSSAECAKPPTLKVLNIQKSGAPLDMGSGSNPTYGKRIVA